MYFRYFRITDGPVMGELARIHKANSESFAGYKAIADEFGISQWVLNNYQFGGFVFDTPPDSNTWRSRANEGLSKAYLPRKNTRSGKALHARLQAIPPLQKPDDALKIIGISTAWLFVDGRQMVCAGLCAGFTGSDTVFVQVPWKDVDPEILDAYKAQRSPSDDQAPFDPVLEHLLWEPHSSMREVQEWEMLKWRSENPKPSH